MERFSRDSPSTKISPEVGFKNPNMNLINVDFPHPLGPVMAVYFPAGIERLN